MTTDDFITHYPQLYHMANEGAWPSIKRWGMLSTTAILDLLKIPSAERVRLESHRRAESVTLTHPEKGSFVLRDQKPMRDSMLARCLQGVSIPDWYRYINRTVFFWPTEDRVMRLSRAKAYRDSRHLVLTVDTRMLLAKRAQDVRLTAINIGATLYNPPARGLHSFRTLAEWPNDTRPRKGTLRKPVAEVGVDYRVPDVANMVMRAWVTKNGNVLRELALQ